MSWQLRAVCIAMSSFHFYIEHNVLSFFLLYLTFLRTGEDRPGVAYSFAKYLWRFHSPLIHISLLRKCISRRTVYQTCMVVETPTS